MGIPTCEVQPGVTSGLPGSWILPKDTLPKKVTHGQGCGAEDGLGRVGSSHPLHGAGKGLLNTWSYQGQTKEHIASVAEVQTQRLPMGHGLQRFAGQLKEHQALGIARACVQD